MLPPIHPWPGSSRGPSAHGRLVYAEKHDDILTAKQREMNMKHWPRAWKVRLIHGENPDWEDLYDRLS